MSKNVRKYDCLIFDWDGTLMDSTVMIVSAVQKAAVDVGLPMPSEKNIRSGIGTSFDDQFARLFPADSDTYYADFKSSFYRCYNREIPGLYPGVIDLLQELSSRGYLLSIATSGSRAMLQGMFRSYDIEKFFSITCTADEYAAKPSPDMLNFIVSSLAVDKERSLMIGDSVNDIYAASNAGISAVGVTSGVSSGDYLSSVGAIEVVDDIRDLLQII